MGTTNDATASKPVIGNMPKFVQVETNQERLELLARELISQRVSDKCKIVIRCKSELTPMYRLAENLTITVRQLCQKEIENVLLDGLSDEERLILLELSLSAISNNSKETAHALFNLPARVRLVNNFGRLFKALRNYNEHMLRKQLEQKKGSL
jgi:hypothetical protein